MDDVGRICGLLAGITRAIVENSEIVKVKTTCLHGVEYLTVMVAPADRQMMLSQDGLVLKSLIAIIGAIAARTRMPIRIQIVDNESFS